MARKSKTKRTPPRQRNWNASVIAVAVMRRLLDEHEELLLALLAGRKANKRQQQVIAEYEARKTQDDSQFNGEPGPSKVDPDAPPEVQLCQLLAYGVYLITEMTYQQYCDNHDACTST